MRDADVGAGEHAAGHPCPNPARCIDACRGSPAIGRRRSRPWRVGAAWRRHGASRVAWSCGAGAVGRSSREFGEAGGVQQVRAQGIGGHGLRCGRRRLAVSAFRSMTVQTAGSASSSVRIPANRVKPPSMREHAQSVSAKAELDRAGRQGHSGAGRRQAAMGHGQQCDQRVGETASASLPLRSFPARRLGPYIVRYITYHGVRSMSRFRDPEGTHVALVTGSTSGIGLGIARALAGGGGGRRS